METPKPDCLGSISPWAVTQTLFALLSSSVNEEDKALLLNEVVLVKNLVVNLVI